MIIHKDIDGQELTKGSKVAFVDMISRTALDTGVVVGSTTKRIKVEIKGELKPSLKTPQNVAKLMYKEKANEWI